jgi:transcriptional antiterminator NusG
MSLYAIKTTASHEETVADMVTNRGVQGIHAALAPDQMTSYVIVEAESRGEIDRAIDEIPHARKVLEGETAMAEVEGFLQPTSDVEGLEEGAVVRVTDGPFQGEKAKITEIDGSNERATVELYEATVPIPVEVRGDQLRVLDKDEWDKD